MEKFQDNSGHLQSFVYDNLEHVSPSSSAYILSPGNRLHNAHRQGTLV